MLRHSVNKLDWLLCSRLVKISPNSPNPPNVHEVNKLTFAQQTN